MIEDSQRHHRWPKKYTVGDLLLRVLMIFRFSLVLQVRRLGGSGEMSRSCGPMPRVTKTELNKTITTAATPSISVPQQQQQQQAKNDQRELKGFAADAQVEMALSEEQETLSRLIT